MTAKEYVKTHYPKARAERQVEGRVIGMQKTYWLIRDGRQTMYMAVGTSESNAWVNAKKMIEKRVNATNEVKQ
jgi:hypothetical protein